VTYTRTKASEGQEHSHFLDEIDQYKINSGVKNAVLEELRKGYSAKEATKNFVGKGKASIYPEVIVCGGEYLDTAEEERSQTPGYRSRSSSFWERGNLGRRACKSRGELSKIGYEILAVKSQESSW
jgi:hypothetical protein